MPIFLRNALVRREEAKTVEGRCPATCVDVISADPSIATAKQNAKRELGLFSLASDTAGLAGSRFGRDLFAEAEPPLPRTPRSWKDSRKPSGVCCWPVMVGCGVMASGFVICTEYTKKSLSHRKLSSLHWSSCLLTSAIGN